jgi:hypothetical protein
MAGKCWARYQWLSIFYHHQGDTVVGWVPFLSIPCLASPPFPLKSCSKHVVFGKVTSGTELVRRIETCEKGDNDRPAVVCPNFYFLPDENGAGLLFNETTNLLFRSLWLFLTVVALKMTLRPPLQIQPVQSKSHT